MKIIAIVRTLNEQKNIGRFLMSYRNIADEVLIADGGSEDNTVKIAKQFSYARVREFDEKKKMQNELWRNPEAEHLNFLVEWAEERNADWILMDDCDCVPNVEIQRDFRNYIIKKPVDKFLYAVRLYIYKDEGHLSGLSIAKDETWMSSLWGWKANIGLRFFNTDMAYSFKPEPKSDQILELLPEYCLLHYAWPDDEEIKRKMDFYHLSGQIPDIMHPLKYGGKLEPLPEWATWITE